MKVHQLMAVLKNFDPNHEVWVDSAEGDGAVWDAVDAVYNNLKYGNGVVIISEIPY